MNWSFVVGYLLGTLVTLALKRWDNTDKEEEGE
jgi:hypothetical protein